MFVALGSVGVSARKIFCKNLSKDAKGRDMMVNHGTKRHYAAPSKPSRRQIGPDIEHTEHSIRRE